MPRYIAFLRAVNVGKRQVKMDHLRQQFAELGFTKVATIIASGNVVFETAKRNQAAVENEIEEQLFRALGFTVETLIRSEAELRQVVENNPFAQQSGAARSAVYALFLRHAPAIELSAQVAALDTDNDQARVGLREVYWRRLEPGKASEEFGARLARLLDPPSTSRNMNTVRKIVEMHCRVA